MSLLFQLVATFLIISIPNVCFLYICIYGLSISDVFKGRGTRQLPRPYLVRAPLEEFHVQIFYVLVTPKQIIFKCFQSFKCFLLSKGHLSSTVMCWCSAFKMTHNRYFNA